MKLISTSLIVLIILQFSSCHSVKEDHTSIVKEEKSLETTAAGISASTLQQHDTLQTAMEMSDSIEEKGEVRIDRDSCGEPVRIIWSRSGRGKSQIRDKSIALREKTSSGVVNSRIQSRQDSNSRDKETLSKAPRYKSQWWKAILTLALSFGLVGIIHYIVSKKGIS